MPWYQTAGILIAAAFALLSLPKLLFDTFDAAPLLRHRMLSMSAAAEKATAPGAKMVLAGHADALANRLAAVHTIRYSGRDKCVIGGVGVAVPILWGAALVIWSPGLIATLAVIVVGTLLLLTTQPRLAAVQGSRRLFAELGCPKHLQRLAVPSFRDYMWNLTITPKIVLAAAMRIERESPPSRLKLNQVTYVNRAIAALESNYRHAVRPR
ncbi:hypothetical protein CPI83_05420 [Rhodococcus sp. H-CA8f]|uniref:hypothetical protein n=1 Tax=Rhodococcus TaxID=1827 RepID=UPI000BE34FB2|nr:MULTISPECIES: hypothetical protein [Rhodococcus]ATI31545.1 hypothetical protein CPI83_05420 [Rhodococcus sp. H-CA8f]MCZ4614511.1 hypothetical protein [Rhodococcus qingshengii]